VPSPLYPGQPQPSPTSLNPASSFPPPPSGASFQHGRPGLPATSVAYALPTGPTGTLPAASDLPASQRTGLRLDGGAGGGRGEGLARYLTETSLTICACFMASAPCEAFLGQPKALLKHLPTHSLWFAQGTMLWHHLVVRLSRTVGEWWHSDNLLRLMPTPAVWLQSQRPQHQTLLCQPCAHHEEPSSYSRHAQAVSDGFALCISSDFCL